MTRAWSPNGRTIFPWSQSKASRGVTVSTSLSKKKDAILTFVQKDPAAAIFDIAGKRSSNRLGDALNAFETPSRVMWRAYEDNAGRIEAEMEVSVEAVMKRISALEKKVLL
jgi:hypothetical protein